MAPTRSRIGPSFVWGFAVAACLAAVAAYSQPSPSKPSDPRLRWEKQWGPLVPHNKFSKDCSLCHIAKRWDILRDDFQFDHLKETGYALEGAHAQAACLRCHNDRGPVARYVARGCGGCHADPHQGKMGLDCTRCHNQVTWEAPNAIIEHAKTSFPLTGMHAALQCIQCHPRAQAQDYRGSTPACYTCHSHDYAQAPNHLSGNFPKSCGNCHNTSTWSGVIFNHSFLGNISNCYACHANNYNGAPNHLAMNFPHTCGDCHNTNTWAGAQFNHGFLGSNPNCYACHASNYASAPNHVAFNYPHTCGDCHNTNTWAGASFNHGFLGSNPNCYACHAADYNRGPNHNPWYPTTCGDCHTTTTWAGATFNHPFPQNHGNATTCSSCHTAPPANSSNYTCTNACHPKNQTDSQHSGVGGYQYSSPACYSCHPNGRAG